MNSKTISIPPQAPIFEKRSAGVLAHITSLPNSSKLSRATGVLGQDCFRFIDLLASAGFSIWQVLPLGPVNDTLSPYDSTSAFAGNTQLIDHDYCLQQGWLSISDLIEAPQTTETSPKDLFIKSQKLEKNLLFSAYKTLKQLSTEKTDSTLQKFSQFKQKNQFWLIDYAMFHALHQFHEGKPWWEWQSKAKNRDLDFLKELSDTHSELLDFYQFEQFLFYEQWQTVKDYAAKKEVTLLGDMAFYVTHNSADIWVNRSVFLINPDGSLPLVSGVPPDYFSENGQRWGNPIFNWQHLEESNFEWLQKRLSHQLEIFDIVRLDHFRAFESFWAIPGDCPTAKEGSWCKTPGEAFFRAFYQNQKQQCLFAEDLGEITPEVYHLRNKFHLPGLRVLQFGFDGNPENPHLPYNFTQNCIAYSGTHDNDTSLGWFQAMDSAKKTLLSGYIDKPIDETTIVWEIMRLLFSSSANIGIVPLQDLLNSDSTQRMNTPGTLGGNWQWRFEWSHIPPNLSTRCKHLLKLYGRIHD